MKNVMATTIDDERILTASEKLETALDILARVRDDVRVRAHLAGFEARRRFAELDRAIQRGRGKPTQELVEALTQKLHELDAKSCARAAQLPR